MKKKVDKKQARSMSVYQSGWAAVAMEGRRGGIGGFSGVCERQQETRTRQKFGQEMREGACQEADDSREKEQCM